MSNLSFDNDPTYSDSRFPSSPSPENLFADYDVADEAPTLSPSPTSLRTPVLNGTPITSPSRTTRKTQRKTSTPRQTAFPGFGSPAAHLLNPSPTTRQRTPQNISSDDDLDALGRVIDSMPDDTENQPTSQDNQFNNLFETTNRDLDLALEMSPQNATSDDNLDLMGQFINSLPDDLAPQATSNRRTPRETPVRNRRTPQTDDEPVVNNNHEMFGDVQNSQFGDSDSSDTDRIDLIATQNRYYEPKSLTQGEITAIIDGPYSALQERLDKESLRQSVRSYEYGDEEFQWQTANFHDAMKLFQHIFNSKFVIANCEKEKKAFKIIVEWYNRIQKYNKEGAIEKIAAGVKLHFGNNKPTERQLNKKRFPAREIYIYKTIVSTPKQIESLISILTSVYYKISSIDRRQAKLLPGSNSFDPELLGKVLAMFRLCRSFLGRSMIAFMQQSCGGMCNSLTVKRFLTQQCTLPIINQ
jgi:hypothetical protein